MTQLRFANKEGKDRIKEEERIWCGYDNISMYNADKTTI